MDVGHRSILDCDHEREGPGPIPMIESRAGAGAGRRGAGRSTERDRQGARAHPDECPSLGDRVGFLLREALALPVPPALVVGQVVIVPHGAVGHFDGSRVTKRRAGKEPSQGNNW